MHPEILDRFFPDMNLLYVSRYPKCCDSSRWLRLLTDMNMHFDYFDFAG